MSDHIIHRPSNFTEVMSWLGKQKSEKKTKAARRNGKLGGRPKGSKNKPNKETTK